MFVFFVVVVLFDLIGWLPDVCCWPPTLPSLLGLVNNSATEAAGAMITNFFFLGWITSYACEDKKKRKFSFLLHHLYFSIRCCCIQRVNRDFCLKCVRYVEPNTYVDFLRGTII